MARICVAVDTFVEIDDADWAEFGGLTLWLDSKGTSR